MVLLIVFKTSLPGPLSFDWDHDIYEACPACVRAHELRSCDGKTKVTFEICQRHRDACDAGADSTALDDAVLKEIRTFVHPLYSPIPTFPVITSTITAKSKDDLRKKVKVTTVTEQQHQYTVVSRRGVHATATKGNGRDISGKEKRELDQPWPEIKYVHGGGCIYSSEPEVVLKPRAAVVAMDQYAREKLRNITALLDSGITCTLGPQLDLDPDANMDSLFGAGTQGSPGPGSGSSGSTASAAAADDDDESTPSPASLMLRAINAAAAAEARALLVAEKERLEECLATSALAKGLYFKRCNGQCVNALGDVLVGEEVMNVRDAEEEVRKKDDHPASTCNDANANANPTLSNSHPQDHLHVGEDVEVEIEAETESSRLTRTSTPSMTASRSATPSLDTSISPNSSLGSPDSPTTTNSSSDDNSNNGMTTSNTNGTLEDLEPRVRPRRRLDTDPDPYPSPPPSPSKSSNYSSYGYGYGVLPDNDTIRRLLNPGTQAPSSPTSISSPSSTGAGGPAGPIRFPPPPPEQPSFTYAVLQAREQLVRSGQVTDENLCLVSWGYNGIISGT